MRKIYVLIFLLLAGTFFCEASSDTLSPLISYKHYGEEDGLHCKTVYEVIQDKEGFLWFATDAGAFRFDGKAFKQYNIEDGVTDKEVLKIFQDSYGRIWFLTLNGYLSFWKNGKIYNPSNTPFLTKAYVGGGLYTYFEDSKKRIWIGTTEHIYVVIDGDSVEHAGFTDGLLRGFLSTINVHEDAKGNIWTFSSDKMFRFFDHSPADTVRFPQTCYIACHGKKNAEMFFLSEAGGVYKVSDKTVSLYADANEVPYDIKIVNMVADQDNLWICTQGSGCFKVVNGKFSRRYLDNVAITSVYRDRENNLWFNTMGEGVYMLPSSTDFVKNYNEQSGLSASNITSFLLDSKNRFWLGYKNGTVQKVEHNAVATFILPGDLPYNRVISMTADSGIIFCGTDRGAYSICDSVIQFARIEALSSDIHYPTKQIFISNKKNIYVAHSGGLLQLKKSGNNYFARELLKHVVRAIAITQYPDDRFLISITTGLMEYVPGKNLIGYETDVDFSSTRILDMKPAPGNLLALATNGNGIYFLKEKKLYQHLTTSNGLSDNNCRRIFVSGNTMYVSTDKGLNVLVRENEKWRISHIIETKNGLLSNTVSDAAERNGIIYVATEKGLSVFNKAAVLSKKFIGKAYATEIVTDSLHSVTDTVHSFKADISRLLIRFSYPVFDPANELKVNYRLVQNETDNTAWITSQNNEVEFSSLSPGQYIFQLKPNVPLVSTAGITSLYINILPLWWQTTAAKVIIALLTVGLIALIVRRRTQLQYKKKLQQLTMLEAERSRIASDMHDDIGADLTQISIWSGILKSSENGNKEAVTKITRSSNEVLQKMEQIIWALNSFQSHTTDLVVYLREFALQYLESTGIQLLFDVDETLPEFELSAILKRNIFLTIKELLHNTVKHSGAKNVSIKIYHADSVLHVEYRDDGRGFTPKVKEDGLGNITIQKRMQEINSAVTVKSSPGEGFSAHLKINLAADSKIKK